MNDQNLRAAANMLEGVVEFLEEVAVGSATGPDLRVPDELSSLITDLRSRLRYLDRLCHRPQPAPCAAAGPS